MFKKLLSLMLCVALVFAMGTITFAAEETTEQTETVQVETEVKEDTKTEEKAEDVVTEVKPEEKTETEVTEEVKTEEKPETEVKEEIKTEEKPETEVTEEVNPEEKVENEVVPEVPDTTEPIKLVVTDSNLPVQVNGVAVSFEDVGLKKVTVDAGDITLVPIRKIAEMLNCTVAWRNSDQTVHIFKNGKSVVLAINNPVIKIYDFEVGASFVYTSEAEEKFVYAENKGVTPVIEAGRTLVPLRAISECLNTTVNYDGATGLITINDNDAAMLNYKATIADIKARNLIETYNYKPVVELKSGSIIVKVAGNFEGATPEIGDGVTVTIDGKAQTTANGGTCTFTEVKSGTYKVEVTNIPEGFALQNAETTVTVEGGEVSVNVYLVKAEATQDNTAEADK